jgi:RNA polymerase sigma-70 factor, ECF subfamily
MMITAHGEVRAGLAAHFTRLWRYGLVLSGRGDIAEDLVQATCVRAFERAAQFTPGTRLDRWLFAILHSIWLNEVRARRIREGGGLVDANTALSFDGRSRRTFLHLKCWQKSSVCPKRSGRRSFSSTWKG